MGTGPKYVTYVFVFLGSIIVCSLYKLTLSDQAQVTLQLWVRTGLFFFFFFFFLAHQYKIFSLSILTGGLNKFFTRPQPCYWWTWPLQIVVARRVTWSELHTENPPILFTTVQSLVADVTWCLGFVHSWSIMVLLYTTWKSEVGWSRSNFQSS